MWLTVIINAKLCIHACALRLLKRVALTFTLVLCMKCVCDNSVCGSLFFRFDYSHSLGLFVFRNFRMFKCCWLENVHMLVTLILMILLLSTTTGGAHIWLVVLVL